MSASRPEDLHRLLAEAVSAGDIETALALFEPGAVITDPTGKPEPSLREAVENILALKPKMKIETLGITEAGSLALLRSRWSVKGTAPDGTPVEMTHHGVEIARRQPDGRWLIVLDHPFGGKV